MAQEKTSNGRNGRLDNVVHVLCLVFAAWCLFIVNAVQAAETAEGRFILKLAGSVELSADASVRRLETEGQLIQEVLERNGVEARWVRAGSLGTHILLFGDSVRPSDRQPLLNRLQSDPTVEFVIEDAPVATMASANDVRFAGQWALRSDAGRAGARFDQAWDQLRGSASAVVAVVDTGVVYETPELQGRLLPGYDFVADSDVANDGDGRDPDASDPGDWIDLTDRLNSEFQNCPSKDSSWHGTFIAGQIAARTNNSTTVAGADWYSRILPVRVSGKCRAYSSDLFDGMLWAAGIDVPGVPRNPTPARVINVSLGSDVSCHSFYQRSIDRVVQAGAVVVAAAGNGGNKAFLPGNCNNVLSVAAVDRDGSRAYYSAIGSEISLAAPGGYFNGLLGLGNDGTRGPGNPSLVVNTGTSFASPLVAAAASLVIQANPDLSPAQVMQILKTSTQAFLSPNGRACVPGEGKAVCDCTVGVCGSGMLDAQAAVIAARGERPLANGKLEVISGRLTLDGRDSQAALGRVIASHRWRQLSGSPILSTDRQDAVLDLPLGSISGDLIFELTVTDSVGQSHTSYPSIRLGEGVSMAAVPSARQAETPSETDTASTPATQSPASAQQPSTAVSTEASGGGGGSLSLGGLLGLFGLLLYLNRPLGSSRNLRRTK